MIKVLLRWLGFLPTQQSTPEVLPIADKQVNTPQPVSTVKSKRGRKPTQTSRKKKT